MGICFRIENIINYWANKQEYESRGIGASKKKSYV